MRERGGAPASAEVQARSGNSASTTPARQAVEGCSATGECSCSSHVALGCQSSASRAERGTATEREAAATAVTVDAEAVGKVSADAAWRR